MSDFDDLPASLRPHQTAIAATLAPRILVTPTGTRPRENSLSRFGGTPWWPKKEVYPHDKSGRPLWPILQIDLAEAPALDAMPKAGLLQFFVGGDFLYGLNCDDLTQPEGFACRRHIDLAQETLDDFGFLQADPTAEYVAPIDDPLIAEGLNFTSSTTPIGVGDHRFRRMLPEIAEDGALTDAYYYWLEPRLGDLWLGGHPAFAQVDPRRDEKIAARADFTLLTFRAVDRLKWGDMGAAQFFMTHGDLGAGDFSKVIYNWDCH